MGRPTARLWTTDKVVPVMNKLNGLRHNSGGPFCVAIFYPSPRAKWRDVYVSMAVALR